MAKRKKHNSYSAYWKKKALKVWSEIIRGDGCAICKRTDNTDAHHMIRRVRTKYVLDLNNGICLCKAHHNFNIGLSAHAGNQAEYNFFEWLSKNVSDKWVWFMDHKDDQRTGQRINYEDRYYQLKALLEGKD